MSNLPPNCEQNFLRLCDEFERDATRGVPPCVDDARRIAHLGKLIVDDAIRQRFLTGDKQTNTDYEI